MLRRPSFGIGRKLWEQVQQELIRGVQLDAKTVRPPYLHHATTVTLLSLSR
jgi:hypothetical protein